MSYQRNVERHVLAKHTEQLAIAVTTLTCQLNSMLGTTGSVYDERYRMELGTTMGHIVEELKQISNMTVEYDLDAMHYLWRNRNVPGPRIDTSHDPNTTPQPQATPRRGQDRGQG